MTDASVAPGVVVVSQSFVGMAFAGPASAYHNHGHGHWSASHSVFAMGTHSTRTPLLFMGEFHCKLRELSLSEGLLANVHTTLAPSPAASTLLPRLHRGSLPASHSPFKTRTKLLGDRHHVRPDRCLCLSLHGSPLAHPWLAAPPSATVPASSRRYQLQHRRHIPQEVPQPARRTGAPTPGSKSIHWQQ